MAEAYVYDLDPDGVYRDLDDLPEGLVLEPCPLCQGGDTHEVRGEFIHDDCPACIEGLVPHGRFPDHPGETEEIEEDPL